MEKILLKKSFRVKDLKIINFNPLWGYTGIFTTIRLFGKKPIVYLRSDGYGEYQAIFGNIGKLTYHFMFNFISLISKFISCKKINLNKINKKDTEVKITNTKGCLFSGINFLLGLLFIKNIKVI